MITCTTDFAEYYIFHIEDTMPQFCSLTKHYVEIFVSYIFFPFKILPVTHVKDIDKDWRQIQQEIIIELCFNGKNKSNRVPKYFFTPSIVIMFYFPPIFLIKKCHIISIDSTLSKFYWDCFANSLWSHLLENVLSLGYGNIHNVARKQA